MRLAVFSLCSNQGVPQAQRLLDTVEEFLPGADRFLVLADAPHPAVPYPDGCMVIPAVDLGIPDFAGFAFRYDRMEFAAALKPFAFLHLLGARGYTHCLYFDPDIEVFSPLPAIIAALAANASFILTPHLLAPAEQAEGVDDIAIMRGGIYNLGFLGVSGTREARDLLAWWGRWLRTHCVNDRPIGLFIDQKFIDLLPGLAPGVRILRDPGLNLAYWNLPQRHFLPDAPGGPTVDGHPLSFFHYSGFDPATPDQLSTESALFRGAALPPSCLNGALPRSWRLFLDGYAERLRAAGHGRIPADSYAYGRFASGVPIPTIARRMFRDDFPAWSGDPFANFEAWCHLPARGTVPGIGSAVPSLMMQWLQAREPRLVRFPLSEAASAAHVTRWWLEDGPANGIDRRFLEPQAVAAGLRAVPDRASFPAPEPDRADAAVIAPFGEPGPADQIGRALRMSLGLAAGRVEACEILPGDAPPTGRLLGLCLAPEQIASGLAAVRARLPESAYRVFIPSAERMVLPSSCLDALSEIDEIWAPTRFIQARFVLATDRPVLHMPVAWRFPAPLATGGDPFFGLPWRSYILAEDDGFPDGGALRAAVRAYASAFGSWPSARRPVFAIRSSDVAAWDGDLSAMIAAHDGVILPATADPVALTAGAACLLALHRGEALGLSVVRAMASGVPVIATDYGGCTDLLSPETGFPVEFYLVPPAGGPGPEAAWAEADPDHAAWLLRDLVDRPEMARRRGEAGRQRLENLHSPVAVAAQQARRLDLVARLAAQPASLAAA